jgi:phosphoglycerate dehydrogenase-like enzyme
MTKVKIVVWDSVGNTLWGVRPWDEWPAQHQQLLLAADPDARTHCPSWSEILGGYTVNLVRAESVEQVAAEIADADFVILHKVRLPGDVLRRAHRCRLVQHLGLDYRGVPMAATREMGIPVAVTPLINYQVVAEHTWALILNHLKQLPGQRVHMQQRGYVGQWGQFPNQKVVKDQTLGLAGLGEIARAVARVARAFEMPVIYWDIERFPELEEQYGIAYVEWDELFQRSDILSVHLALNDKTQGIIGTREIGLLKPDAFFVNTARGKLVDQGALVEAVRSRRIGGLGLEVFYEEPIPVDDPLFELHSQLANNVTMTPHSSSLAPDTWVRDSQPLWHNVRRILEGRPAEHLVYSPR